MILPAIFSIVLLTVTSDIKITLGWTGSNVLAWWQVPGCVGLKDSVPSMEFKSVGQGDILADVVFPVEFPCIFYLQTGRAE